MNLLIPNLATVLPGVIVDKMPECKEFIMYIGVHYMMCVCVCVCVCVTLPYLPVRGRIKEAAREILQLSTG